MEVEISGDGGSSLLVAKEHPPTEDAQWNVTVIVLLATNSDANPYKATCSTLVHLGPQSRVLDHRNATPARARAYHLEVRSGVQDGLLGLCALGNDLLRVAQGSTPSPATIHILLFRPYMSRNSEWSGAHSAALLRKVEEWGAMSGVTVALLKRSGNHVCNYVQQHAGLREGDFGLEQRPVRLTVPRTLEYMTVCIVGGRDPSYSNSCQQLVIVPEADSPCVAIILYFHDTPLEELREAYPDARRSTGEASSKFALMRAYKSLGPGSINDRFKASLSTAAPAPITRMASQGWQCGGGPPPFDRGW